MLLNLLQNCGATFKTGEKFISAIRSYLCVSLLSNCTSHVAQVTGLSLQIFVALIQNFKIHLKGELEVFVSTIFFRILESENSTFEHKLRVLEVFHDICRDSKDLVELFINYDCDMEAANLFSNIVSAFAKITKVSFIGMILVTLVYFCLAEPKYKFLDKNRRRIYFHERQEVSERGSSSPKHGRGRFTIDC